MGTYEAICLMLSFGMFLISFISLIINIIELLMKNN